MSKIAVVLLALIVSASPVFAVEPASVLPPSDALHEALAADDHGAAVQAARSLESAATAAAKKSSGDTAARLHRISGAAKAVAETADLKSARQSFGALSREIVALVIATGSLQEGHALYTCPMVEGYGEWVQKSGTTANPYWGSAMLTCGTRKDWR